MAEPFDVSITARDYEVDSNGHIAGAVLLRYGQHARWECLRSAGVDHDALYRSGIGPVSLEEHIRFRSEVRAGEEIVVTCAFVWGEGKTFRVEQTLRRPNGELVAEITNVGGLLDLDQRRLVKAPGAHWRSAATAPEVLGL